jgi:hypothetical protein
LAERRNFYFKDVVVVGIRPVGVKPITHIFQARSFIRQQTLLRVQLIQVLLSANGHKILGFTTPLTRYSTPPIASGAWRYLTHIVPQ